MSPFFLSRRFPCSRPAFYRTFRMSGWGKGEWRVVGRASVCGPGQGGAGAALRTPDPFSSLRGAADSTPREHWQEGVRFFKERKRPVRLFRFGRSLLGCSSGQRGREGGRRSQCGSPAAPCAQGNPLRPGPASPASHLRMWPATEATVSTGPPPAGAQGGDGVGGEDGVRGSWSVFKAWCPLNVLLRHGLDGPC